MGTTGWFGYPLRSFYGALRGQAGFLRRFLKYRRDYQRYCKMAPADAQPDLEHLFPCLYEATTETNVDANYLFQDSWGFEKIVKARPEFHVDIGSDYKFISLLSLLVPTTMVDLRPLATSLPSLKFQQGSILALPYADGSVPSVSSLCVAEHIGLGRYGDPLDPHGTEKAVAELKRIVRPGGDLYLSVPVDDVNRIYFNAHRAFTEDRLLTWFQPFEVMESRYIYGRAFGEKLQPGFGTGCYHLRRPA